MNDLNALFDSVDGLKADLIEYGTIAAGAIGANVLWNVVVPKITPANLNPTLKQYGLPAAAVLGGIFLGRIVSKKNRKLGLGVTIGLVSAGLTQFAKMVVPSLPYAVAGYGYGGGYAGYLNGAPVTAEEVHGFAGAPVTTEEVSGFASVMNG